jgi:hypothetical protein
MEVVRDKFTSDSTFSPDIARKASSAAEGICKWVHAMEQYEHVSKAVLPKQAKLADAEAQCAAVIAGLPALEADLQVLMEKLDLMEHDAKSNTGAYTMYLVLSLDAAGMRASKRGFPDGRSHPLAFPLPMVLDCWLLHLVCLQGLQQAPRLCAQLREACMHRHATWTLCRSVHAMCLHCTHGACLIVWA